MYIALLREERGVVTLLARNEPETAAVGTAGGAGDSLLFETILADSQDATATAFPNFRGVFARTFAWFGDNSVRPTPLEEEEIEEGATMPQPFTDDFDGLLWKESNEAEVGIGLITAPDEAPDKMR